MSIEKINEMTTALTPEGDRLIKMSCVETVLNGLWSSLPEFPKYKEFNMEFVVHEKEKVKTILVLENEINKLHLSSKSTKNKVVYSYLTLISTITDILVDAPLAAMVETKGKNKGRIVGWKFYRGEITDELGVKKK